MKLLPLPQGFLHNFKIIELETERLSRNYNFDLNFILC